VVSTAPHEEGPRFRSSWKASPDPEYEEKAARVLALYRQRPSVAGSDQLRRDGPGRPAPPARARLVASRRADESNVELVPTPTYASYLNRIESHFGAIGEFVVKNSDYLDWDSFGHAMAEHIRYRNQPERRDERLARRRTHLSLAA